MFLYCLISFIVSLISSLELYLGLSKRLDKSLVCYRNFYMLSMKIKQYNFLEKTEKTEEQEKFLQECIKEYESYFKDSEVTKYVFQDQLISPHNIHVDHWYDTSCFGKHLETKKIKEMGINTEKEKEHTLFKSTSTNTECSETSIVILDEMKLQNKP